MKKANTINSLIEFHDLFKDILQINYDKMSDLILKLDSNGYDISTGPDIVCNTILQNNACKLQPNATFIHISLKTINNYYISLVYNGIGNEINDFYDYIEFYGAKYLVVFMDCFKDFSLPEGDELFGKSQYIDMIIKLVDAFISTTTCIAEITGSLATTSASNNYRFAPAIIACSIIDKIYGLTKKDVSNIPYDDIRDMLDTISLNKLLIGIRSK